MASFANALTMAWLVFTVAVARLNALLRSNARLGTLLVVFAECVAQVVQGTQRANGHGPLTFKGLLVGQRFVASFLVGFGRRFVWPSVRPQAAFSSILALPRRLCVRLRFLSPCLLLVFDTLGFLCRYPVLFGLTLQEEGLAFTFEALLRAERCGFEFDDSGLRRLGVAGPPQGSRFAPPAR